MRAAAMGYNVSQYRMALTLLSGFVAAVAGWLYALDNSFVSQDLLGLGNSLNGLLYALVGGAEHVILGPLIGAVGFRYLTDSLGRLTSQSTLYIGVALMIVVYLMPNGLLGLAGVAARRRRRWRRGIQCQRYPTLRPLTRTPERRAVWPGPALPRVQKGHLISSRRKPITKPPPLPWLGPPVTG
jgi:hypothetical protein